MSNLLENKSSNKKINPKEKPNTQINEEDLIIKYINELKDEEKRENAISKLSKYYDKNRNLPIYLWYSQGTMAILLQEVIGTYKFLSSDKLTQENTAKIHAILCLFVSIASHHELKRKFVESKMPIFLYPFLKITSTTKQSEYIKLFTISLMSTLMKSEEPKIISFFINTEIIPILLKILDKSPLLSKIPVCMMIYLIVKTDEGLEYVCEEKMRYNGIILYMRQMLKNKHYQLSIKHTLKTFLRLAENSKARIILKNTLLKEIKDKNFTKRLSESSKSIHSCLLKILSEKDEVNKTKENQKEMNNTIVNININNNIQNINIINDNMKNGMSNNNPQMNPELMNQYNINNNMILMNQINQMKISQPYMIQTNFNDVNNYNIYNNGNENYLNKMNYVGNQNNNKQFMNVNFYNMYKNN